MSSRRSVSIAAIACIPSSVAAELRTRSPQASGMRQFAEGARPSHLVPHRLRYCKHVRTRQMPHLSARCALVLPSDRPRSFSSRSRSSTHDASVTPLPLRSRSSNSRSFGSWATTASVVFDRSEHGAYRSEDVVAEHRSIIAGVPAERVAHAPLQPLLVVIVRLPAAFDPANDRTLDMDPADAVFSQPAEEQAGDGGGRQQQRPQAVLQPATLRGDRLAWICSASTGGNEAAVAAAAEWEMDRAVDGRLRITFLSSLLSPDQTW